MNTHFVFSFVVNTLRDTSVFFNMLLLIYGAGLPPLCQKPQLNCYFCGKEIFEDDGSIEHIVSETAGETALNIGNLILLEQGLNREAGEKDYLDKLCYYKKSKYDWLQKFVKENDAWSEEKIRDRAEKLADIYYKNILERAVSEGNV